MRVVRPAKTPRLTPRNEEQPPVSGFFGLALKILGGVAALGLAAVAISGLVAAAGAVEP